MRRSYTVFNRTRCALLASQVESTERAWARMKGLIGRSAAEFQPGRGLWIKPSEGIHTIGMKFPIDALYLDANHRVNRVYQGLRPWRVAAVSLRTRSVLELPAGTLERCPTEVGDVLEFEPTGGGPEDRQS